MEDPIHAILNTPGLELDLTPAQHALRAAVREYVQDVVIPARSRLDAVRSPEDFPWDVVEPGCALGLRVLPLSEAHGGIGADVTTLAIVAEELAAGDLGIAYYFKHNWRFAGLFPRLPGELSEWILSELRTNPRFLPASATSESMAGSDNNMPFDAPGAGLSLRAERDGDEWVLNGTKWMITNGSMASLYMVLGRTDPDVGVSQGATMFAVRSDTPGISYGPPYEKLGQRASIQTDVIFTDCRVPAENQIGEIGTGLGTSLRALIGANIINAAMAVGVARAAYHEALRWSTHRVQGGVPIYEHQLIARDLGTMRIDWEAARCYTWSTARAFADRGPELAELAAGCNVFATEAVVRVTRCAMEMFGGRGMMAEWPAEKLVRDALTLNHASGTNPLTALKLGRHDAQAYLAARPTGPDASQEGLTGHAPVGILA